MTNTFFDNSYSRVFTIEDSAGPSHVPQYQGIMKAGAVTWAQGDITRVRNPDPDRYGNFLTVGKIRGEQGIPQLTITARYTTSLSDLLRLVRRGCEADIQVHMGLCSNPQDFNGGWDKVVVLSKALATNYTTEDLGALQDSERAVVNEEVPFSGEDYYEIKRILFGEQAAAQITQPVVDVAICDDISCGLCGIPSDGCQRIFAVTNSSGASPGLSAEVVYSDDSGGSWNDTDIATFTAGMNPSGVTCVGTFLAVVSATSTSVHYASIIDILNGVEVWASHVSFTLVGIQDIFSLGPTNTWAVGGNGQVYFFDDITAAPVSQVSPNSLTINALNAVTAMDALSAVAVGDLGTVIYTADGGGTWALTDTAPSAANLNTVAMKSANEWFVGTADGKLFYTSDAGTNWTEKTFPGSGVGVVRDIAFTNNTVGWLAHNTAAPAGRILRTIDGGRSWYVAPEGTGNIPPNDYVAALAVCVDPNVVFGGGLADNATDGFLVKGA